MKKPFLTGLLGGILATLFLTLIFQILHPDRGNEVMAEVGGEKLTRKELRRMVAPELIPVENDRYRVLKQGADRWVTEKLVEKEAKKLGVSTEELYRKQIWSRVKISYSDLQEYYNKNQEIFGDSFEKLGPSIAKELRHREYLKVKKIYLQELRKKHKAKVYIKKPRSYVEGLALPVHPFAKEGLKGGEKAKGKSAAGKESAQSSKAGAFPSRGPESAPITLMEFADFHCGFCKKVNPTLDQLLQNYPGKVRVVFRHHPLSDTPGQGSYLTHEASVCAQEQGKFWEYHDEIFALQGTPKEDDLYAMAKKLGLNSEKFEECLKGGRARPFLQQELQEGSKRNVQGTPTLFVNEEVVAGAYPYEHFVDVIEGILNPGRAPKTQPPTAAPSPVEEGRPVQFDDLKGRPALGPKEAPITMVEFSDFHCSFCGKVTPTLEKLMENYRGKIRRVWRHYPLPIHTGADRTHEASECAHEQNKFWEYHDKLFSNQGGSWDDATLIRLAGETGINKKKFERCLSSGKHKDLIQKEIQAGTKAGVQGTPAAFVNGRLVSGAQPYDKFEAVVQSELLKKS